MSTQQVRKVTVFTTKGKRKAEIETDATVWEQLKALVKKEGYDVDKLLATENITRRDLANAQAVLPTSDFVLFLRPTKTKSGSSYDDMTFKQLRAELSDDDKTAISHMFDKNYTRCSGDDIKTYLNKTRGKSENSPVIEEKPVVEATAEEMTVSDVVESVKDAQEAEHDDAKETLLRSIDYIKRALDTLRDQVECYQGGVPVEQVEVLEHNLNEAKTKLADAEKRADKAESNLEKVEATLKATEAKLESLETQEEDNLEDELNDLMSGF